MKVINKPLPEGDRSWKRNLITAEIEQIILHDPGDDISFKDMFNYLASSKYTRPGSYHDIIDGDILYHCIDYKYQAFHCGVMGGSLYNRMMWGGEAERGFQNMKTLGVCVMRPFPNSWDTVVEHAAGLCKQLHIDPFRSLGCHYLIDDLRKTDPIYLYEHPSELERLRFEVYKLL